MITCKSPRKVLRMAFAVARDALPAYSHRCSPRKFTQHQLFACLVLKSSLKCDYRGVVSFLEDCGDLRAVIGLESVPHFTTLQKAANRLLRSKTSNRLLDATLQRARHAGMGFRAGLCAAIDGSGFEAHHVSHYFVRRRAKGGESWQKTTYRRFPKAGIVVDCATHLILSAVPGRGPSPDYKHFLRAVRQAHDRQRLGTLIADAGYDAEWAHEYLRIHLGIRSLIRPGAGRPTHRLPTSYWRRLMASRFDHARYGQRWQVETVFSMIKRRQGSTVNARRCWTQSYALLLKALTHNILILKRPPQVFYRAGQAYLWTQRLCGHYLVKIVDGFWASIRFWARFQ